MYETKIMSSNTATPDMAIKPTAAEMDELGAITKLLSDAMDAVHKAVEGDVANLNKALNDAGVPRITAEEPPSSVHPPQPILP